MSRIQIAGRIVEMFEHVEHRDGGAAFGRKRCSGKRRTHGGNTGAPPGGVGGIERKIEADGANVAAFCQHLEE